MRIFVTGASGWIGSAAIPELLAAGHQVLGLARSDSSAATVEGLGAEVHRGSLDDIDSLTAGARAADGVVHLGYNHDFSAMGDAADTDRRAIEAMAEVLAGSGGPLLIASGTLGVAVGRLGTENDRPDPASHPRVGNAAATLELADRGIRPIVVRFAPTVHGTGDHGFAARLVEIAREKGVSGYVGDGTNRWPAVHRFDAGRLVALAVDRTTDATVLHAVAESGVPARDIAEAIARNLGVPAAPVAADDAESHFGWLGGFFAADVPVSNDITRESMGWEPREATLIEDLDQGHYTSGH